LEGAPPPKRPPPPVAAGCPPKRPPGYLVSVNEFMAIGAIF
tara:strand:+ start:662 stop:784 length:123 start_codon:yes stop_codon:yes gene_type:complete